MLGLNLALALGLTGGAAWTDARTGSIPDRLTLPVLAFGCATGGLSSVASALLCASLLLAWGTHRGLIGGGDVKLLGALTAVFPVLGGLVLAAVILGSLFPRIGWKLGPFIFRATLALAVASRLS